MAVTIIPRQPFYIIPPKSDNPPNHPKGNCQYCGKELTGQQIKWCADPNGYMVTECSRKYYEEFIGIKVWWPEFRKEIIKRDNFECQDCGYTDMYSASSISAGKKYKSHYDWEVHHINPVSKGGDTFDKDNCVTLCADCHKKRHRKGWVKGKIHPRETKQMELEIGSQNC